MRSLRRIFGRTQAFVQRLQVFALERQKPDFRRRRRRRRSRRLFLRLFHHRGRYPIPRDESLQVGNFVGLEESDPIAAVGFVEAGGKSESTKAVEASPPTAADRLQVDGVEDGAVALQ